MSKHKKQVADTRVILTPKGDRVEFPVNRAARRADRARQWQNRPNWGKPGNKAAYLKAADHG